MASKFHPLGGAVDSAATPARNTRALLFRQRALTCLERLLPTVILLLMSQNPATAAQKEWYAPFEYIQGFHATFESAQNRMRELAGPHGPYLEPVPGQDFPVWEKSARRWRFSYRPVPVEPELGQPTWYNAGTECEFGECLSEQVALERFFDERRKNYCVRNIEAISGWEGPALTSGTIFPSLHVGYDKRYSYQLAWRENDGTCSSHWEGRVHDVGKYTPISCPAGYEIAWQGDWFICNPENGRTHDIYANPMPGNCDTCQGNPVALARGAKRHVETLYASHWLTYRLHYNSKSNFQDGLRFGSNWLGQFSGRLILGTGGNGEYVHAIRRPGGAYLRVSQFRTTYYVYHSDEFQLAEDGAEWRLGKPGGEVEVYDDRGLLTRIERPGRPDLYVTRGAGDRVVRVEDDYGRALELVRDSAGRLLKLIGPAGEEVDLQYASNGRLSEIRYPDGTSRSFRYHGTAPMALLAAVIDEKGVEIGSYDYDDWGRVIRSEEAGGVGRIDLEYMDDRGVKVTEPGGNVITYEFRDTPRGWLTKAQDKPCATECSFNKASAAYDSYRRTKRATDFNGNVTTYSRNNKGQVVQRVEAVGTPLERTITMEWHPDFRVPTRIDEPGRRTEYTYDADGNRLTKTVTDTGESRTTTWTYNAYGQVASIDGPRTDVWDVTTYGYDAEGNLATITNALGHVTQITQHDAHGNPLRIVDPNGVETVLTYDLRQRLTSRSVDGATTRFGYDAAGQLTQVTLPGGATLTYEYDAAHRLVAIEDHAGNRIDYTLDALGNRTAQEVRDAGGTLRYAQQRVFDQLSRLEEVLGNNGQSTQYDYDANGNRTAVTEAGLYSTLQEFDALDRLTKRTDADNGETVFQYDALGNLVSVADPEGPTTSYDYNAFGDLVELDSPDTGVTTYTYDKAGNRLFETDARGVTVSYSYDALNRPTLADYPGTDVDTVYHYDGDNYGASHPNAVGRLTGTEKSGGTIAYFYDARGNLIRQATTLFGNSYDTVYTYDADDNVTQIVYPSGRTIGYQRDGMGRVTEVTATANGQTRTLAEQITYLPFGGIESLTLGNGQAVTMSHDLDYRLTDKQVPGLVDLQWSYDTRNNVTAITDAPGQIANQSFTYDALSRLSQAQGPYGTIDYTYDGVGNRLSRTVGGSTQTYAYASDSHRLQSVTDGSGSTAYTYDATGNTLTKGAGERQYDYGFAGRLARIDETGATAHLDDLRYNAHGQRFHAELPRAGTREIYHYDQQGRLIVEMDHSGDPVLREYVYLEGMPLAMFGRRQELIQGNTGLGELLGGLLNPLTTPLLLTEVFYFQTDHLGTPRLLTDSLGAVVWQGEYKPFGEVIVTTSAVENPLRFPGQRADGSGTYYNYFRDYDPSIGRYIQSDPIGLRSGLNTYAYVGNKPIGATDPFGLGPVVFGVCNVILDATDIWQYYSRTDDVLDRVQPELDELNQANKAIRENWCSTKTSDENLKQLESQNKKRRKLLKKLGPAAKAQAAQSHVNPVNILGDFAVNAAICSLGIFYGP